MIQRRGDYENDPDFFNKNWKSYVKGFGDQMGEFWLGLWVMKLLTDRKEYELLIQLWNKNETLGLIR